MFDGGDACGGEWTIEDFQGNNHFLMNSQPNTQYAYFVETNTVSGQQHGGLSPIQYFTTLREYFESDQTLDILAKESSKIE